MSREHPAFYAQFGARRTDAFKGCVRVCGETGRVQIITEAGAVHTLDMVEAAHMASIFQHAAEAAYNVQVRTYEQRREATRNETTAGGDV